MIKQALRHYLSSRQTDKFIQQWLDPLCILPIEPANNELKRLKTKNSAESKPSNDKKLFRVTFPHQLFGQCFMMHARQIFESSLKHCFGDAEIEYSQPILNKAQKIVNFEAKAQTNSTPFSFSSFITGNSNYFALQTAQGIARGSIAPNLFNPFCICGKSGSGKTHILMSLTDELRELKNMPVFYTNPHELFDQYKESASSHITRQKIFAHQALILDDLQQIEKNIELQEELIILFDHFFNEGKVLAFASLNRPEKMDNIIFPLLSRMQRGICANLKEPDMDVRIQFIKLKSEACNIPLTQKQTLSLATQFTTIRQLEGIIHQITAYSYALGKKVSEKEFEKIVSEAGGVALSEVTSSRIIELTAEYMQVSAADIIGAKRSMSVARARQTAMYLCRELLKSSYPELGNIFGGKDQSTAMYSVKKVEKLHRVDKDTHKLITTLKAKCLGL